MKKLFTLFAALIIWSTQTVLATDVSGTISTNTLWDVANSPYIVTSSVTVDPGVTLTIDAGVTVQFNNGQNLIVLGTLTASGTTFTSVNPSPAVGDWGYIQTGDASYTGIVNLTNCQVEYAQTFNVYAGTATLTNTDLINFSQYGATIQIAGILNMTDGDINTNGGWAAANGYGINGMGTAALANVTIQHFAVGICLLNNFSMVFNNSNITNCVWPIYYMASADLTLLGTNTFAGNTYSLVNLGMTNISDDLVLPSINIPYYSGTLTIDHGASLTLPSASTYKFAGGAFLYVYGHLTATNTIFTSNSISPNPGDWSYIQVGAATLADSGRVTLTSCQINYPSHALWVNNGIASISNTAVSNTLIAGIAVGQNGTFNMTDGSITTNSATALASHPGIDANAGAHINISGVTIQNYQYGILLRLNAAFDMTSCTINTCGYPICYAASAELSVHGTNNFSGNTYDYAYLTMTSISDTLILPAISVPYYAGTITINHGGELIIPSGSTYKLAPVAFLYVYGHLTATGTTFNFNSTTAGTWDWSYIQVGSTTLAADSGFAELTSCQINYGGLYVHNGKANLLNTDLINTHYWGAYVEAMGTLNMTNGSIITNCGTSLASYWGVYALAALSHVNLSNVNIQHFSCGLYLGNNAKVDFTTVSISNCYWPIYYAGFGDLTVHGVITLTGNTRSAIYMASGTLTDTIALPTLSLPYFMASSLIVNVGARLEIGEGNILKFPDGNSLNVYGTLVANAGVGNPIYFTSHKDDNWGGDSNMDGTATAAANGSWYGIIFYESSVDANCVMRRCNVRYAGYSNIGGVTMYDASPTIDYCNLSFNYYGICLVNVSSPILSYNTIGSSSMTPIAMSYEANPVMIDNVLSFSDNAYDAIGLIGGIMTANATLIKRNVTTVENITYLMLSDVTVPVGKTLTINKGITIKSYYWGHRILVNGELNANATADSLITFTSSADDNYGNPGDCNRDGSMSAPAIGNWGGITFNPGSTGTLNYCRIRYASQYYQWGFTSCSTTEYMIGAGVETIDASPTISNCEFKDLNYGISCHRVSNPIISDNSFININYTPVSISGSSDPVFTGNTFTNVKMNAIGLLGGNVCQNGTIKKRDVAGYTNITYVLLGNMTIYEGTYVDVEADVVIKMNACNIFVSGGFKTNGTAGHNVVFTSIADDNQGNPFDSNGDGSATAPGAGSWGSIYFYATSDDAYCNLNYATLNFETTGVIFENAGGQVNHTTFINCANYGVYCNGNSTPSINNVIIQNCAADPIAMSLLSDPTFSDITFIANGSRAIKIIEGSLSSTATLATRNVAGITNIAYVFENLNITTNGSLTILPGVVIKFRGGYGIAVNGTFIAKGTASHKIYFTSFADDSKGGDSNNNGNGSAPGIGDWAWYNAAVNFANCANDTMKYCEISYPTNGFGFTNAHAVIDNCVIQLVSGYGAHITGTSNPEFTNCQFLNIAASPIRLSMFSNPSFSNITCLNVGWMALTVIPETYSQSATIPIRNFGGYNNITYYMEGVCGVSSGTTITIPAGVVFKGNGFGVNGRLNSMGTALNPVVFTNPSDDNYGNPADMHLNGSATAPPNGSQSQPYGGTWLTFSDISNDSSIIQHTIMKYAALGVSLTSASPNFDNVRFENLHYGVDLNGVSEPNINNCTFHNLRYYPLQISLVSFPASITNNIISGTTYKVIKIRDETLTQDITLNKRSFGGVNNITYLFGSYTIGTGATLTIDPGVVCKFNGGGIWVNKGLIADGGFAADSNIVFTDIRDDFYGGDANADSNATVPTYSWNGITFMDLSLDPLCHLKHGIIKYATYGIYTQSASPQITYSTIANNYYGVYATASSNPIFNYCDFNDNYYWSINNVDKSFVIDATNCWWGSNLGPIQTNTQGTGISPQELVTTAVNYTPYLTTGATVPLMGDVSLNGLVQAYDASLVLQNVVSLISLNNTQEEVADVSFNGSVTSYDASLILQYVVGIIQVFPAELRQHINPSFLTSPLLTVGSANATNGQDITIPLSVTNPSGMISTDIKLHYDPNYLQLANVTNAMSSMNMMYNNDYVNGILTIAMAGIYAVNNNAVLANITFHTSIPFSGTINTNVDVLQFLADENDMTSAATPGIITISDFTTDLPGTSEDLTVGMDAVYPNPSSETPTLTYQLSYDNQFVKIDVFNMIGQKVITLVDEEQNEGVHTVSLSNQGYPLDYGCYIIRMTTDSFSQTQKFQIVK